jgi:hypothetical protein
VPSRVPDFVCHQGSVEVTIPRRLVVPIDVGMRAVTEFAATGARPTSVTWEEALD